MTHLPPEQRMGVAVRSLAAGFYRDGLALHEARREIPDYPEHRLPMRAPAWDARQPLAGRRVLLWHEQGLGDMIQMLRFMPLLAQRGAAIVLAVQPPLKRLAAGLPGVTAVVSPGDSFAEVDFHCPLMSLPHLLGIRLATLPAGVPYLRVPSGLPEAWRSRLGPKLKPRVGLVFSGAQSNTLDRWRSIPARAFAPLLAREDIDFHVLQNEIRAADRDYLAGLPHVRMHEETLTDLSETAGLAMQMDRIITVCTAVAHLSGALGLPTWVLLSTRAHWVWLAGRSDSPWYPTARLFRQQTESDWQPVMQHVAMQLRS
ncbi:MAG TPA: hypothetical protein VFN42_06905 [Acetobacteraceae bacterium]|nr:hypothetical protein [Acetobacteraceae bacterium]